MPDPRRITISATEAAALFNASPYITRWMLHHKFASKLDISRPSDNRMSWGTKLQPLILQQVASDKKLEVIPNADETYVRCGLFGCHRDAVIICPDRGPGALEIKCVFDYKNWMDTWRGGGAVPRHYEIQLQTQMYVGEGEENAPARIRPFTWGMIAVWVCAELYYFERKAITELHDRLKTEGMSFWTDVWAHREPDPFGTAAEAPFLREMYPTQPESLLDLTDDPDHVKTAEDVSMFATMKEQKDGASRVVEQLRLRMLALAAGCETVLLPCGYGYRVQKSGKGWTVVPIIPASPTPPPPPRGEVIIAGG